jgi:hypothetical protein
MKKPPEPPNENWKPYTPGRREFPPITPELKAQLERVEPSSDGRIKYWPCRVSLRDGRKFENVYVMDAQDYISIWGVWPDEDTGKRSVPIEHVLELDESPNRLPAWAADKLYRAGESGMGYVVFSVRFRDGAVRT